MVRWLEKNKVKGDIFPGLFDTVELWKLNSTRCRGFNLIFFPLYVVFLAYAIPYTCLCLAEAIIKKGE